MQNMPRTREINSNQKAITQMLIEMGYKSKENDYKDERIKKLEQKVKLDK